MAVIGVAMVKDEIDVVEHTLGNMILQVDGIVIADNMSTDGTFELLEAIAQDTTEIEVVVVRDEDPRYRQSEKMTGLAELARLRLGAEWIVPFDADEWWYSPHHEQISDALAAVPADYAVVSAALYDHVATAVDDTSIDDPTIRIGWRRIKPAPLPKVACRWAPDLVIEQGNHGAHYRYRAEALPDILVVRHFPYRSVAQVVSKVRNGAAAYNADPTLPANFGVHWREWGVLLEQGGEQAIADLFHEWYWSENPHADDYLIFDPAP